jgi:type I restriction enzyme S subunit
MKVRDGYKMTELGLIPTEWEVLRAEELFKSISKKNFPEEKVLTVTQDRGTVLRDECGINIKTMSSGLNSFKLVEKGNFIISLRSFQGGLEYSSLRGIVSPAYTILESCRPIVDEFYKYFFKSDRFINILDSAVIGIRDGKQISYSIFKEFKIRKRFII